jgi:hypothetical protein
MTAELEMCCPRYGWGDTEHDADCMLAPRPYPMVPQMAAPCTERIVLGWMIVTGFANDFGLWADCFAGGLRQCLWRAMLALRERGEAITPESVQAAAVSCGNQPVPRCSSWYEIKQCVEAGEMPRGPIGPEAEWLCELARRRRLQAALVDALEHVAARRAEDTCIRLAIVLDAIADEC